MCQVAFARAVPVHPTTAATTVDTAVDTAVFSDVSSTSNTAVAESASAFLLTVLIVAAAIAFVCIGLVLWLLARNCRSSEDGEGGEGGYKWHRRMQSHRLEMSEVDWQGEGEEEGEEWGDENDGEEYDDGEEYAAEARAGRGYASSGYVGEEQQWHDDADWRVEQGLTPESKGRSGRVSARVSGRGGASCRLATDSAEGSQSGGAKGVALISEKGQEFVSNLSLEGLQNASEVRRAVSYEGLEVLGIECYMVEYIDASGSAKPITNKVSIDTLRRAESFRLVVDD